MDKGVETKELKNTADENAAVYLSKQMATQPTNRSAGDYLSSTEASEPKVAKRIALQTVTNTAQGIYRQYSDVARKIIHPLQSQQHTSSTSQPAPISPHRTVTHLPQRAIPQSRHVKSSRVDAPAAESTSEMVDHHSSEIDEEVLASDDTIEESLGSMDLDYPSMEQAVLEDDYETGERDAVIVEDEDGVWVSGLTTGRIPASENLIEMEDAQALRHHYATAMALAPASRTNPDALFPVDTPTTRRQLFEAAEVVAATPGLLDEKDEDWFDAGMVSEYGAEIFTHMRKRELALLPNKSYMDSQQEITWQLRRVLVDWLVQVHHRFNLLPETLFLTINYIDRFMSVKDIALSKFQLVGAVALFLAAKYEEINYLSVQEVTLIVENQYPASEITKAERYMVDLLNFNLGFPGPMSFLRRASKADDYDLESRTLAKYLLEITIIDERFVASPPSWTAAISLYLSRVMLQRGPWTHSHTFFAGYTEEQLLPGVNVLRECIENAPTHHKAVFDKYSERKFRKAALFVREWVHHSQQ